MDHEKVVLKLFSGKAHLTILEVTEVAKEVERLVRAEMSDELAHVPREIKVLHEMNQGASHG